MCLLNLRYKLLLTSLWHVVSQSISNNNLLWSESLFLWVYRGLLQRCHGRGVSDVVMCGSFLWFGLLTSQLAQAPKIHLILHVISGHHTGSSSVHLVIPWWPAWILSSISGLSFVGTTILLVYVGSFWCWQVLLIIQAHLFHIVAIQSIYKLQPTEKLYTIVCMIVVHLILLEILVHLTPQSWRVYQHLIQS